MSAATNQWTLPATVPASLTVGTTFCEPPTPPILRQPETLTAALGSDVTFTVLVAAAGPFSYQWRRKLIPLSNGGNISGADDDTLRIGNCDSGDAGSYDVVVTSVCGGATSEAGSLSITTGVPMAGGRALAGVAALMALAGAALIRSRRRESRAGQRSVP